MEIIAQDREWLLKKMVKSRASDQFKDIQNNNYRALDLISKPAATSARLEKMML